MINRIYNPYLSDSEIKELTAEESLIKQMLRVEMALAKVQAEQGLIPQSAAMEIGERLKDFTPPPEALAAGTLQHGIPSIPLLALAQKELSSEAQHYLHWGATSQDIMDTAAVLIIKEVLKVLEKRLLTIIQNLKKLARQHKRTYMVARTRTQQAVPIAFGLKAVNWAQPLDRHLERLEQMRSRLLVIQFGGAGGSLAALGDKGWETAHLLAKELQLGFAGIWHAQRDNMAELSAWLALVAGSLGKMAQDILVLNQTELGEVAEQAGGGGRSSTMPHKHNPVWSEAVVALAHYAGQLAGNGFQAMLHRQERDAAAWALEWLTLPPLMVATGTALNHGLAISENMQVNKNAMKANLEKLNGLVFSEQASFILCQHMSRSEAKKAAGRACQLVAKEGIHLAEALGKLLPDIAVEWKKVLRPEHYQGATEDIISSWA